MSFQNANAISLTAGAAISQGRFVKVSTGGKVIQAAAGTDEAVGVALEAAAADLDVIPCAKYDGGIVEVEAGAAVTVGADVSSDSVGRAVAAATSDAIAGWALSGAGAAGEFIKVLLVKGSLAAA